MNSVTPVLPVLLAVLGLAACQSDSLPSEADAEPVPQADVVPLPDSWVSRAPMPTGRAHLAVASVGGMIYAIGGRLDNAVSAPTDRVEAYRPTTTTLVAWRPRASLPQPRGNTNGAAVIDGRIYVSGGFYLDQDGETLLRSKSLYRYDPATNSWTTLADMPRRTSGGASVAIDGKLYVYAVYGPEGSVQSTIYRYDPATNVWAERAQPPAVQGSAAATVAGGRMYVIGGSPDKGLTVATVSVYDPVANSWSLVKPLQTPRMGHTARTIDGRIYVAGGGSAGSTGGYWTTEVYDPATDTWSEKADILTRRIGPGSAAVGGKFYVIGGRGIKAGRVNEMYTP